MLITKKKFLFSSLMLILGVLQISMLSGIMPVKADDTLLNSQPLLTQVGNNTYGANPKDIKVVAIDIINLALSFLALAILILFFMAGYRWMMAGGNQDAIKKAKSQMINAVIGLVIVLSAWGISVYILKTAQCVTTSNTNCYSIW